MEAALQAGKGADSSGGAAFGTGVLLPPQGAMLVRAMHWVSPDIVTEVCTGGGRASGSC